jgi:acetylglutamate kinase
MKRPVVVKIGGGLLETGSGTGFWRGMIVLREHNPVLLVHGGGPQATSVARRLGHEPRIVHGRRVTGDTDIEVVQWTMRGQLSTRIVAEAHRLGIRAVGLSGVDAGILQVRRRPPWVVEGETVDFGWVGDVVATDTRFLVRCLSDGVLPVVSPLGVDVAGGVYNVNADTVAESLASALNARELLLVTEKGGLRRGPDGDVVAECDRVLYASGMEDGWITEGMRVKLKVAFDALDHGVEAVWIVGADDLDRRETATRVLA